MIIYGSRMYGKKDKVNGWGFCDHCGNYSITTSYTGRKWGHIYFIPLIPMTGKTRVVQQCKKCSNGIHFPEKDVPNILKDLRQSTDKALAALISGQKTFDDNGTTTSAPGCLAGSVMLLYCLQAEDQVRKVLSRLKEKQLTHPHHLVNGESLEYLGKLDEAIEAYKLAAVSEPQDPAAIIALGSCYLKKNEPENAKLFYQKALTLSDDKLSILQVLLAIYESTKDFQRVAETYEECFKIVPELASDKKVMKAYKKACKKAGKEPRI